MYARCLGTRVQYAQAHLRRASTLCVQNALLESQGTEAHDQMLGKVFGYAAIVRCKRPIDQETAVKCTEGLVHIANKKSFLRELAANVVLDLTGDLPKYCSRHAFSTACVTRFAPTALSHLHYAHYHICSKQQLKV